MTKMKATIGDVIEIVTSKGLAYAQLTHRHTAPPRYDALIRVFSGDVRRLVEVRVTVERLMSDFNGRFVCCQERAFRQLP